MEMWCTSENATAFSRQAGCDRPLFVNNNPSRKVETKEPFVMHQSRGALWEITVPRPERLSLRKSNNHKTHAQVQFAPRAF
jgi:hypothetical protein